MNKESKDFLKNLLNQCGVSGAEEQTQSVWIDRTVQFVDKIDQDVMGNAIAIINEDMPYKIMLAGHCDEIGFMVTHISDEGFLHITSVGGIDRVIVPGSHVRVLTNAGHILGVIGKKAIHLEESKERGKCKKIQDLVVDIGAKDKKDAEELQVEIGNTVCYAPNFIELYNDIFSSKGCDDKVGMFVVSEVMKILSERKDELTVGVYSVSTVQEEVGCRGAVTSAYNINPDVGIAVDVSWTSDVPGDEKKELGNIALGKGAILHPSPATNRKLYDLMLRIAQTRGIPYQVQASGYPGGTDTANIQLSRNGVATSLVSIPNRYMHTTVETCSYKDLVSASQLIAETILNINPDSNFIPGV